MRIIYEKVKKLNKQNQDLIGIFRLTDEIESEISSVGPTNSKEMECKEDALFFFQDLYSDFEKISKRTDRLTPKIKVFLNGISRGDEERRMKLAFEFLLSKLKVDNNRKLQIPTNFHKKNAFSSQRTIFYNNVEIDMEYDKKNEVIIIEEQSNENEVKQILIEDSLR